MTRDVYNLTMQEIDVLMKKGEANLTSLEVARLHDLAKAAEEYEDNNDEMRINAN